MFTLATLPTSTELMSQIGAYSSPLFSDLLLFAIFAIGFIVGGLLIAFLINIVSGVAERLIRGKRED